MYFCIYKSKASKMYYVAIFLQRVEIKMNFIVLLQQHLTSDLRRFVLILKTVVDERHNFGTGWSSMY